MQASRSLSHTHTCTLESDSSTVLNFGRWHHSAMIIQLSNSAFCTVNEQGINCKWFKCASLNTDDAEQISPFISDTVQATVGFSGALEKHQMNSELVEFMVNTFTRFC